MFIEDPLSGQKVSVSPTGNRQNVSSRSDTRIYYISRDNGDAYSIVSIDTPTAAGEYNFYFKNTSTTQKFYVTSVNAGSGVLASFKVAKVTGTAAGTAISATNLNTGSGNTAQATIMGNGAITGLTESAVVGVIRVPADDSRPLPLSDAFVLGQGEAFAIEYDVGAGSAEIDLTILGFFDVE